MEIKLTNSNLTTLIDDEDFDRINSLKTTWCLDTGRVPSVRATKDIHRKCYVLARFILGVHLTSYPFVDHINGDGLDNRKSNLRLATYEQNAADRRLNKNSTSGCKGVKLDKKSGKWKVGFSKDKKFYYFGAYKSLDEAVKIAKESAVKLHGSFAKV